MSGDLRAAVEALVAEWSRRADAGTPVSTIEAWAHARLRSILAANPEPAAGPICTCPEGHEAQTRDGAMLADYCPTHGMFAHPEPAAEATVTLTEAERHRDALADTGDAYHAFHGWVLNCLWCEFESVGKSKAEALRGMQRHYDAVLPEGATIRG